MELIITSNIGYVQTAFDLRLPSYLLRIEINVIMMTRVGGDATYIP